MDGVLETARYLIDRGAEPEAAEPSLLECFLQSFYRNNEATEATLKVAEAVEALSGPITDRRALQEHYEVGSLPNPLKTIGGAVWRPLISRNVLPTEEQFEKLRNQTPDHAQDLLGHLPARKQRYLQAAISKERI